MVDRRSLILAGGAAAAVTGAGGFWSVARRMGSMEAYGAAMAALRAPLPADPAPQDLVRFATLAANSHNAQPWRFHASARTIDILPDLTRRLPAVDPDDHHLFASLGCAGETLAIAAAARGLPGEVAFDPAGGGAVGFGYGTGAARDADLCDAVPHRQSTRGPYDGTPVGAGDLATLARAAALPGVDLILLTDRARIDGVADLIAAGNGVQMADAAFMAELKHWLRFNPRAALASGDGLFSATTGNPLLPDWLGPRMVDLVLTARAENARHARHIASSAGLAVFVAARADPEHWVLAGRACQRFSLAATALGLKHAYLNQPVEVPSLRADLAGLVGAPGRRPDLVMRFGRGAALPFSARRPVGAVLA